MSEQVAKVKYSKSRIIAQTKSKSLKYMDPMAKGDVLVITDVIEKVFKGLDGAPDTISDIILTKDANGGIVKVPTAEFTNMTVIDGGKHYTQEPGEESIELPRSITIVKAEDRMNGENKVYPIFSYAGVNQFLKNEIDYEALMKTELDENAFSPVQNYTVELAH
jgi:hypothetical protein